MLVNILRKSVQLVPWSWRAKIKRMPLVASMQRWLLARYLEGKEFVHTVDAGPARGLRYPVTLPQDKGVWTGTYELEFCGKLLKAVRPGDVCLDLGAWRGFFSGVFALAGASQVFAIEPLPVNVTQILKLKQLNPNLSIHLIEAAVGNRAGVGEFWIMPQTSMGKVVESTFQQDQTGKERISVRIVSLDELLEAGAIEVPAVIKVDVEGGELEVLLGARRLLSEHHPSLFMEIHSRALARECSMLLRDHGYLITVLETGWPPNLVLEPEVCHFEAIHSKRR